MLGVFAHMSLNAQCHKTHNLSLSLCKEQMGVVVGISLKKNDTESSKSTTECFPITRAIFKKLNQVWIVSDKRMVLSTLVLHSHVYFPEDRGVCIVGATV